MKSNSPNSYLYTHVHTLACMHNHKIPHFLQKVLCYTILEEFPAYLIKFTAFQQTSYRSH